MSKTEFEKLLRDGDFRTLFLRMDAAKEIDEVIRNELESNAFKYKIHLLIDGYSLFHGVQTLYSEITGHKNIDVNFQSILSEMALGRLISKIKQHMNDIFPKYIYEESIFQEIFQNNWKIKDVRDYVKKFERMSKVDCSYTTFFARDVDGKFESEVLDSLNNGGYSYITQLELKDKIKNLRAVPVFFENLNRGQFSGDLVEGFLKTNLRRGKATINEKEVDVRITIKAMEILHQNMFDSVILISSDTDFVPLKAKFLHSRIKFFQIPLGPMIGNENHKISNRIKPIQISNFPFYFSTKDIIKYFISSCMKNNKNIYYIDSYKDGKIMANKIVISSNDLDKIKKYANVDYIEGEPPPDIGDMSGWQPTFED